MCLAMDFSLDEVKIGVALLLLLFQGLEREEAESS
jgi:hypothetical protein